MRLRTRSAALWVVVLGCLVTTLLVGAGAAAPVPPDPPPGVDAVSAQRAREAAGGLMKDLLGRLSAALAEGGPPQAVEVCSRVAPEIAAARSTDGLRVSRTSLRPRNPANAPDDFERRWLEHWAEQQTAGEAPQEVMEVVATSDGGRELRYLRPILLGADVCLRCHGTSDEIDPQVRTVLAERYPDDQATGYRLGDLRGAVTVRVALDD